MSYLSKSVTVVWISVKVPHTCNLHFEVIIPHSKTHCCIKLGAKNTIKRVAESTTQIKTADASHKLSLFDWQLTVCSAAFVVLSFDIYSINFFFSFTVIGDTYTESF